MNQKKFYLVSLGCAKNTVEFHQGMQPLDLVGPDHMIIDTYRSHAFRAAGISLKEKPTFRDQD